MNKKLQSFMYFLAKDAERESLMEWLEEHEISKSEYEQISFWFKGQVSNYIFNNNKAT